jgi:hypothetical protein
MFDEKMGKVAKGKEKRKRTVRFILPFLFSLYDKYVCSPMLIFPMIVYFNC